MFISLKGDHVPSPALVINPRIGPRTDVEILETARARPYAMIAATEQEIVTLRARADDYARHVRTYILVEPVRARIVELETLVERIKHDWT